MSGLRTSHVWDFFKEELRNDNTKVKCLLCGCVLSRGGTGRTATTSGMINHLKLKHKEIYLIDDTPSTSVSAPEHSFDTLI